LLTSPLLQEHAWRRSLIIVVLAAAPLTATISSLNFKPQAPRLDVVVEEDDPAMDLDGFTAPTIREPLRMIVLLKM
jgi:hypothetical protein